MKCVIKMKDGGSISPEKAREILADGTIRGKKITDKQRKFFGAMSNKAENGATIEQISENSYSSPIIQFNGPSHDKGGIDIQYAGQQVEVEGQETGFVDQEGSLVVLGNLKVPGTNTKFKNVGKEIASVEVKTAKQLDKGMTLINEADPYDPFDRMKFNSGVVMSSGAQMKQKELSTVKEGIAALQNDILEQANALGVKPEQLQKGKAKYGIKLSQTGSVTPLFGGPGRPDDEFNQKLKQAIGMAESSGNYTASPNIAGATAFGKYQFTRPTLKGIYEQHYKGEYPTFDEFNRAFRSTPQVQESVMSTRLYDLRQKYGDDVNRIALVHRLGEGGANNALRNPSQLEKSIGKSSTPTDKETPNQYLQKIGRIFGNNTSQSINPPGITLPEVEITGRRTRPTITPNINFGPDPSVDPGAPSYPSVELITPPTQPPSTTITSQTTVSPYRNPLRFGQIAPEVLTIATERAQFVPGQRFEPNLYQPYQVSFQDRLNENQATFNAISRQLGGNRNTAGISALAAQKYQADSQVLADEFRTNQGITNDITNRNIALLNQAQLTNIELNDEQFVRQEQARANTRQNIRAAVQSISDKIQRNVQENMSYNFARQIVSPQYGVAPNTGDVQFLGNPDLQFGQPSTTITQTTTRRR